MSKYFCIEMSVAHVCSGHETISRSLDKISWDDWEEKVDHAAHFITPLNPIRHYRTKDISKFKIGLSELHKSYFFSY